jgi:uncharacterized protein (TIGR00255 family)
MTGFGSATRETDALLATVEAKAVNGRFLKITIKAPPTLSGHDQDLERLCKSHLKRGSITLSINLQPKDPAALVAIDETVVRAYQAAFRRLGLPEDRIPTLPGVIGSGQRALDDGALAPVLEAAEASLVALLVMRKREGAALAEALGDQLDRVDDLREQIGQRAPVVVAEYQSKLAERIAKLLADTDVAVQPEHLAREVAFFADRCDVTEEVDRLGAHVAQARELLAAGDEVGRSLEFLAQEMHREVNTIGSKSADTDISRHVVALKGDLERMKEQLANIE